MSDLLEELNIYLRSDDGASDCLMLSDLDGFLTGLMCSPKPVANWFDVAFVSGALVPSHIKQLVGRRLKDIEKSLSAQSGVLEPAFWQAPKGHAIAILV
ncbi:UPF0149 family protein [Yoonia sp. R2-816]|uniref:UPF0149 family protein n=1 Tax=Yoonia sp. R2-816 TaxID=3342638 RepID=UPI00372CD20D